MAKSPPKKADSLRLEFEPDAWERFESLVKSAAKLGPMPHKAKSPQPKKQAKKNTQK
jgi:hypothetical protein